MATGRGVDRATGILAEAISEFANGVSESNYKLISDYLLKVTDDKPRGEHKIDAMRKLVVAKSGAVTSDELQTIINSEDKVIVIEDSCAMAANIL